MKHIKLESANIVSAGHDPDTKTLEIKFKTGATYSYDGVPTSVYKALVGADSVGSYFHKNINGKYPHSRV